MAVAVVSFVACAFADTWYADASKTAGTGNGKSAETAFHTIQEAIDAASANDTISVAEGTYDEGARDSLASYSHGGYTGFQQTRVLVTKKLTIIASGEKSKTVILGSEGTPEHSTNKDYRWYRTDSISCMALAKDVTGVRIEGLTFKHGFAHQSAGSGAFAAGGLSCYATGESTTFQDAFTVVNCDFVDCYGRGAGGIRGGTAIRCLFKGCMSSYRGASAFGSRLFNCIARDSESDANSVADFVNCLVVNCTIVNNFGKFGLARTTNTGSTMPEGFGTAYNTVCYANVIRYQDANDAKSSGYAHNVVCDLNKDASKTGSSFEEGSTDVVYLNNTAADMTTACVCPATLDFRPVKGGCLDGKGKQYDALAFVPAEELKLDFFGNPFDGDLPIGAILPSAEVKSGVLSLINTYFNVEGHDCCTYPVYVQSEFWPAQVKLRGSTHQSYKFYGTQGAYRTHCSYYDYVLHSIPPKTDASGAPVSLSGFQIMQYSQEFFVGNAEGQNNASDDNAGTAEAPFKTIGKAIASMPVQTDGSYLRTVIRVRPGTYSIANGEPGGTWGDTTVKGVVSIPAKHPVMIIAEEGPDVTFIEGQPDPDTLDDAVLPGCGPNAYRCVMIDTAADGIVAGFTLRNGYSSGREPKTSASVEDFGSGALTGGANQYIYDCVITGCHGSMAAYRGIYHRCVFKGNDGCLSGVGYGNAWFAACVFDSNTTTGARILYNNCNTYNCTFYERACPSACYMQNYNGVMVNCAIDTTGSMLDYQNVTIPCIGSVIRAASDSLKSFPAIHENPYFTAPWNGDYRIHEPSAAVGAGVGVDPHGKISVSDMTRFVCCDLHNNPLANEGSVNAGAIAETTPPSGIYVDAVNGNDANDGLTEAKAKKTLQAAVNNTPGNAVVVALPGVYKEGFGLQVGQAYTGTAGGKAQPTIRSRVAVPPGMTLISRDGPEVTIIEGAPSEGSTDAYGRGPKAIRGVFLDLNAKLSGFTVRYGHSDFYRKGDGTGDTHATLYQDDLFAGGVLGRHGASGGSNLGGAVVENCILTENYAPNGGAGCLVTFRNCRVMNNVASSYGSFFRHGEAYNCYVANNRGPRVGDCVFNFVNCTFEDNMNEDGGSVTLLVANMTEGGKLWNLLSLTESHTDAFGAADVRNVVLAKETKTGGTGTEVNVNTDFTYAELKEMFTNGRPTTFTAPTVDQGFADAATLLAETDVAGTPRVQNRTIDIGAFEADWRGAYAEAIGRRVTVTEASPSVVMTDGHPQMQNGDALAATVEARSPSATTESDYVVKATLSGAGTMRVYLNDELLGELTASGELSFTNGLASNDLRFEYEGEGSAYVAKVSQRLGAILIIR